MSRSHEPVLLEEAVRAWCGGPGLYLDATVGAGGHAAALLEAEPEARLLGGDRDPESLARAAIRLGGHGRRVMLAHGRFRDLPDVHRWTGGEPLAGALIDLGMASTQLDDPSRGMSFQETGPLDLRLDRSRGLPASAWLEYAEPAEVARVLREHGDLLDAARLARTLVTAARAGALRTTGDLVRAVSGRRGRAHPRRLAQVFQALRTHVNDEAGELDALLAWLPSAMRAGGTVVTLAYHSGEDRRIKHALRGRPSVTSRRLPVSLESREPESPWQELTRKVVTPSDREKARNPRARSARLRAFRRKSR
jgi:16S rRNA (cytosine1402-N4)-methyltransferase